MEEVRDETRVNGENVRWEGYESSERQTRDTKDLSLLASRRVSHPFLLLSSPYGRSEPSEERETRGTRGDRDKRGKEREGTRPSTRFISDPLPVRYGHRPVREPDGIGDDTRGTGERQDPERTTAELCEPYPSGLVSPLSLHALSVPFHINSLSFLFVVMWERNVKRIRMKNPVGAGTVALSRLMCFALRLSFTPVPVPSHFVRRNGGKDIGDRPLVIETEPITR